MAMGLVRGRATGRLLVTGTLATAGNRVMEGKCLRSLVDAYKFTLTYPEWCLEKGITLEDFLEWMQARCGGHARV